MKAQLCKCNNCNAIMVDMNPADQPEFEMPDNVVEMFNVQEEGTDGNLYENYWGCPNCRTDAYLIDITGESQLH